MRMNPVKRAFRAEDESVERGLVSHPKDWRRVRAPLGAPLNNGAVCSMRKAIQASSASIRFIEDEDQSNSLSLRKAEDWARLLGRESFTCHSLVQTVFREQSSDGEFQVVSA